MKSISNHNRVAGCLLAATGGVVIFLNVRESGITRVESDPDSVRPSVLQHSLPPSADDFERRSRALPLDPGDCRPFPDKTLIALSEKRALPEPETAGERLQRSRLDGYELSELQALSLEKLLADVVTATNEGRNEAAFRGFARAVKARVGTRLQPASIQTLVDFLRHAPEGLPSGMYYGFCNEIANLLATDADLTAATVDLLAGVADDSICEPVVRDYVVQYFGVMIGRTGFQRQAEEHLLRWISEGGGTTPGSAFLVIESAILENSFSGNEALLEAAVEKQLSSQWHECQVAALSLGLSRRYPSVAVHARSLAADTRNPPTLRIAAIHALGELGDRNADTLLLGTLLEKPGSGLLRGAVESALIRLTTTRGTRQGFPKPFEYENHSHESLPR